MENVCLSGWSSNNSYVKKPKRTRQKVGLHSHFAMKRTAVVTCIIRKLINYAMSHDCNQFYDLIRIHLGSTHRTAEIYAANTFVL